jgi:putative ABC transport system permease protein
MTSLATGLLVCASVFVIGLVDGLSRTFSVSADELKLIVMRKGSDQETGSQVEAKSARELSTLEGIAMHRGVPMCSPEHVMILTNPRRGDTVSVNLIVRGLSEIGRALRPGFHIVEGRDLEPGKDEAITSRAISERFQNAGLGEQLPINGRKFTIVGLFEASGSVAESEVWTDERDLRSARRTPEFMTSVIIQPENAQARDALIERIENDEQFNLKAVTEKAYYAEQVRGIGRIRFIGYFLAGFLSIGAMFGAANTMYSAVASRAREIGTLRALGFSRRSILSSFLLESVVLCLCGGLVGILFTIPFNGVSTGTMADTFSEVTFAFNFGPLVLLEGALLALTMGLLGGFFPAVRAVRINIIQALREV